MGAIIPTSSRITKTGRLHFKVGWDRVSPVGISLFDVEAKTISFLSELVETTEY